MFEGVQDQFHQFLAAAAAASSTPQPPIRSAPPPLNNSTHHHHHLPPPLSFSLLHGCTTTSPPDPPPSTNPPNSNFPFFDSYPTHPQHQHQIFQQVHLQWSPPAHSKQMGGGSVKQQGEGERASTTTPAVVDSAWSQDEILALLRIRSAVENWFPEFTWENVSRKLSEMGFKRSPQKCKDKFEEESGSYFHPTTATTPTVTATTNAVSVANDVTKNNYRLFSELEELYHHAHDPPSPTHRHPMLQQQQEDVILEEQNPAIEEQEHGQGQVEEGGERQDKIGQERSLNENDVSEATLDDGDNYRIEHVEVRGVEEGGQTTRSESKKIYDLQVVNKQKKKFEIFKSFCEETVRKMMTQQEQLHNKILQDMIRRDEEKIAREEAWKKQEMERRTLEMEARAKDLAMVGERQAKIIEFLNRLSSNNSTPDNDNNGGAKTTSTSRPNPSSSATHSSPNQIIPTSSNEESISNTNKRQQPSFRKPRPAGKRPSDSNDIGKRWPREEVLALISIRCNVDLGTKTTTGPEECSQGRSNSSSSNKNCPLWERISRKMVEMGYYRSAKRCKEKWENINKYFRKTKDMNKSRSVDSRTCPYFHQLSHLYNQGRGAGAAAAGGGSTSGNGRGAADGGAMNELVSDQGEGVSGVQVAVSTSDLEF